MRYVVRRPWGCTVVQRLDTYSNGVREGFIAEFPDEAESVAKRVASLLSAGGDCGFATNAGRAAYGRDRAERYAEAQALIASHAVPA